MIFHTYKMDGTQWSIKQKFSERSLGNKLNKENEIGESTIHQLTTF